MQPHDSPVLGLRMVKGLHQGAVMTLGASAMVVVGSGDDCDLILSDPGVANHHCILTSQDSKLLARAMDGPVRFNNAEYAPGTAVPLAAGSVLELGAAAFEVTAPVRGEQAIPRTIAEPAAPAAPSGPIAWSDKALSVLWRMRWAVAGSVVFVLAISMAVRPIWRANARPPHAILETAGQGDLAAKRPGDAVAHDVAEVLRLSGLTSKAQYIGEGTVTVTGHLGDPKALATIIQSRAMREIIGLKRVLAVNLDHPGGPAVGASVDGTRIVSVVASKDPYVITADGSRYYVGASLPQGGRLSGVHEGEVLIERNGRLEHWKLPGSEARAQSGQDVGIQEADSTNGHLVRSVNRHPISIR